ncbi:hypothetical protein DAPPUDRAFT_111136 [Daphnia pulex]|uniref:Uncharacterized protein n=1 Tax=Daphnia pulex TaxID=6669 RepID=E9H884_DAPPU|nr:hypothetical protein DAPPUDRAFT_111136 [Daphnia pulex]|eukprot:EFX72026.1 hypothetical protein DAPPUDRAFT_111136 [Daphnia pulex]
MGLALFKNPADEVESMIEMIDRKQMVYKTTAEGDQADKNHQVTVNTVSELKKSPDKRGTRPVHSSTWESGKDKAPSISHQCLYCVFSHVERWPLDGDFFERIEAKR